MNTCEDQSEPLGEAPDIDNLDAIARASELGMLAGADKAAALKQLADSADAHLARLKRDAVADPYRPADRRALTLPGAIKQAEILAEVVHAIQDLGA